MKRIAAALAALALTGSLAAAQIVPSYAPRLANGLTNSAVTIKSSRGIAQWLQCVNPNAGVVYVQFYDTASAVVVGTTTPKLSIGFASGTASTTFLSATFLAAIKIAATTTPTGGSAPAGAIDCNLGIN